jgi:CelD/BcsL family acetyltransferase involved in cellulose biosynthesis
MPAESPLLAAVAKAAAGRAAVVKRPQASCPYIQLDESWLDPLSHLNAGRRSDLRRARRKAEQLGSVTTEIIRPEVDEVSSLLAEALDIEERSWKGQSGTALARDPQRARFFADFARRAAETESLRMCFLRIGEQRVAMQVALEQQGGFWLLKVGYNAEYAACSPGIWLMHDTIAYAARQQLATYELLGKSDAWTQVWTKTERACASLRVYPYNARGMTALAFDAATTGLAAAKRKYLARKAST